MKKSKSLSSRTDNNVMQIDQKRREAKEQEKWKLEVLEYVHSLSDEGRDIVIKTIELIKARPQIKIRSRIKQSNSISK